MSVTSMVFCAIQGFAPVLFVLFLMVYYRKKTHFSWKPFGIGVVIFIVFSQVLEKVLHVGVLSAFPKFIHSGVPFALYGALAAGVFEEVGRFFAFKVLLKKHREWRDGVSYGLGHGGIEVLLIATLASIQTIIYGILANSGQLDQMTAKLPADVTSAIHALIHTPVYVYILGTIERFGAVFIQIALSLLVLAGVRNKKGVYLLYAILLHALFDFLPGLYQAHVVGLAVAEAVVYVMAALSVYFVVKSKRFFQ